MVRCAVLNVSGATLIKMELPRHILAPPRDYLLLLCSPRVIAGFGIIFLSALTLIKALSMQRFSYMVPVSNGLKFAITVMGGIYIFKDTVNLAFLFRSGMILTGIILTSLSRA
jgi:multidrug transporter EmrE-like cation transporter